jgi:TonB-linked SusC/RagA family outer membrane protein
MKRILLLFVLLLTVGVTAMAQTTHTVTGKIMDEHGKGLPGAGITVRGMQIGTVADVNGDFMLDVPDDGNGEFVIQSVGYNTRIVNETDGVVNVKLQPMAKELEGTIITAQTIRREKRELGYNSTTVGYDDLTAANNTSAVSALQGKVAGANITSSTGGPGGSTRIVLRGENSILKNNNALMVVDGVITNNHDRAQSQLNDASNTFSELNQVDFGNSANDLDPEEIESITVLNGASASVLYGSAGANGALIITTKSGKRRESGKPSKLDITYKATYTESDILKYADVQHEYGQGNLYNGVADDRRENFSWGLPFDGALRPWGQVIDGKSLIKPYVDQPGNIKSFFNHGKDLNNFVSLSGGTETSTYFLSLNALNSSGVVPNTFYNRYSVRFNGTTQLTNNFYSAVNFNYLNTYSRAETQGQGAGSVLDNLYETARDIPVWELKNYDNKYYSMHFVDTNNIERYGQYGAYYKNPFWVAKFYDNRLKSDRVLGDLKIGYKKCSFNFYDRVGVDVNSDVSTYNTPEFNVMPVDPFYAGNNFVSAGGFTQSNYNGFRFYNDLVGNFTHPLGENFGINATVGHNSTIEQDGTLAGIIDPGTNGLVIPGFYNLQNNTGPVIGYNNTVRRRTFGVYGDVVLNFQKELFVEMTGRNDWSSMLDLNRNSYFYPGANASWVFTERLNGGGFKDKVLNYGKVRLGAGGVGNTAQAYANNIAGYKQTPINTGFGMITPPFNGIPAYQVQPGFGDPHLKPEQTREFEAGTDLAFLRNRISFSFTYYSKITDNLITAVPLPPSTGYGYSYTNVGTVTNKGEEIALRGTPISTRWGLKWDLFGTYTHNVNNVQSLTNGVDHVVIGGFNGMDIVAAVGHPFGTFYAADIQYWQDPKTGSWHPVVDRNTGLPVATTKPVYRGSYLPKFEASWGTELTFKGLKLHVLFVTKQGGQFFSRNKMNMDFNGTSQETVVNNRQPYVWANSVYQVAPNVNSYLPNNTKFLPYNYYANEEGQSLPAQGLVNASYIKLQEMSLSYRIPTKYYRHSPFGGLEAGLFGNNLILWTAKSNHYDDPEETSAGATGNGQGFNYTARPSLRNYGAFVKVTF